MTSITSEMASLDSNMPPRTHCSAATSCGGIRSNSSPRCVTSARLTGRHLPLKLQACNPFVRHRLTKGLLHPGGARHRRPTRSCGQPGEGRPANLCAPWGLLCGSAVDIPQRVLHDLRQPNPPGVQEKKPAGFSAKLSTEKSTAVA